MRFDLALCNFFLRIPMKSTTDSDPNRPPVPIEIGQ
jgi:hypothetical protein